MNCRMKLIGYISPTKRLPRPRQEWLMREHDLYETCESIDDAIRLIRKGRALVIPQCSLLASKRDDIKDVAQQVHERGGYIIEAATGRRSDSPQDAFEMGIDAATKRVLSKRRAVEMATKYDDDHPGMIKARSMWSNAGLSDAAIAKACGIHQSTLRRRLGKRDVMPGVKPARKRKP